MLKWPPRAEPGAATSTLQRNWLLVLNNYASTKYQQKLEPGIFPCDNNSNGAGHFSSGAGWEVQDELPWRYK